ncbi:hypothetical protein N7537_007405 [Penicillium hordei]|uniref:DH domain-containing protein n=1 Tax=Penicillium hordei TaxID=40994 RepID=A0AAD6GZC2_9EURO|nr:uncharacterized protein N7537_007405 [Penicillium hordei]KAJ5597321.1 hypothetical protein N7537_007405 [Penicillium hordei]
MADQDETNIEKQALLADESEERFESSGGVTPTDKSTRPFKKWIDSFRGRKHESPIYQKKYVEGWSDSSSHGSQGHQSSASDSSQLGTVKTTTASIGSQSLIRSRTTIQSARSQSIRSDVRYSGESSRPTSSQHADEAAETRATRRRHILQELVETESDYVLGLKALIGILTIFETRREIYDNIQMILGIHERFLTQLHTASPMSVPQAQQAGASELTSRGITKRIGTIDLGSLKGLQQRSLRTRSLKASVNRRLMALTAEPTEGLEVARELGTLSLSIPVYDQFCSNYELLTQDVALLRRSIANWTIYDQGIEALSKSVASTERRRQEDNKSMTLNDMLIKPIQRLCKYPLVLQDLLRSTPVSDCPSSHDGIQQVLDSMRVLVTQINLAAGNPINKDRIHKTVVLQKKVDISKSDALQSIYKDLGPLVMCGVLHVTYQTAQITNGEFMVCVLFQRYLFFAKGIDDQRRLEAVACVYLDSLKIDTLQNGQDRNYEFVLSASSAAEEKQWSTEILKMSAALAETGQPGSWEPRKHSFLALQLLPLDHVQYTVSSMARRSMDSTTISRKSRVQHVVIKKTHYPRHTEEPVTQAEGEIERPKTPADRSALILTARRSDRVRLERLISDVYTGDLLPSPGMVLGRGDLFLRGPLMRGLSLRPGFTKRSNSVSTFHPGRASTDMRSDRGDEGVDKSVVDSSEIGEDKEAEYELPQTPTTPRRSKTFLFKGSPKNPSSSVSSPRSDPRQSQDGNSESSPSSKKWSSPKNLFSALAPKKLKKTRSDAE